MINSTARRAPASTTSSSSRYRRWDSRLDLRRRRLAGTQFIGTSVEISLHALRGGDHLGENFETQKTLVVARRSDAAVWRILEIFGLPKL